MRTSCDIDILVHEEDFERMTQILIQELNYTLDKEKSIQHISMHAPSGVHLEPHFTLHKDIELIDRVFD